MLGEISSKLLILNSSEKEYLRNPGFQSPIYRNLPQTILNGQKVYKFQLPNLKENLIEIRRDSRFTNVPLYIHSNLNVNYVYSGKVNYHINNRYVLLKKGDLCIVDRNVVRSKEKLDKNDIVFNISLSNDFFSKSFINRLGESSILSTFLFSAITENNLHNGYLIFQNNNSDTVLLLNQLINEYFKNDNFSKNAIEALFSLIFIQLIRSYQTKPSKAIVHINNDANHLLEIIDYIEKNSVNCTLADIALKFNYHPKYLSQLIKKTFNMTFKDIQTEQRLKNAAQLLCYSELPISIISEKVGITNVNQFYKKFRQKYSISPDTYRKNKHSNTENSIEIE